MVDDKVETSFFNKNLKLIHTIPPKIHIRSQYKTPSNFLVQADSGKSIFIHIRIVFSYIPCMVGDKVETSFFKFLMRTNTDPHHPSQNSYS